MYKGIFFVFCVSVLIGCQQEVVKKPDNLIEKEVMIDILYDLSLLEAINYQSASPLKTNKITPYQFIKFKYQVDSTRFVKNNIYYASDYKVYQKMFEQLNARLDKNKSLLDAKIKNDKKKADILKNAKKKLKAKKETDSLAKIRKNKKEL